MSFTYTNAYIHRPELTDAVSPAESALIKRRLDDLRVKLRPAPASPARAPVSTARPGMVNKAREPLQRQAATGDINVKLVSRSWRGEQWLVKGRGHEATVSSYGQAERLARQWAQR